MSEDEIIKQLKDSCILDNNCYEVDCLYEKDLEAIRSLLDLYQKEKEKNEELEEENKELRKPKYIIDCKTNKITKLTNDFVSKDKIRRKVIEVKNRLVKDEFITASQGKLNTIIDLEELLEERN